MPVQRSTIFLIVVAALLPLVALAALLWQRFYRDDAENAARRVLKNSAVPLALRMLVRALDMAFFIILQRSLPGAAIGPYVLATLYVGQYLATIVEFGLGVLLTRDVARDPSAARRMFGVTLALRAVLVLCAAAPAAALLIGAYDLLGALGLGEAISEPGKQATWVLLLTLLPSAYSGAVTALYNAAERMEVPALIEIVTAVLGLTARLAALWLGFGIVGLAWASVGVTALTALIFLWLQLRDFFPPSLEWDAAEMRRLAAVALPLMLNNLLNAVFFRFDIFIIKVFGGGNGDLLTTQYDVAYKLINIAMILPPVVTFAVFPMLSRRAEGDRAALARAQNTTLQALLMVAFPISVMLSVLSVELVRLVNGARAEQYLPISAQVLSILAWFLPLSFVNGLLQYVLIALNRQRAITRAFVAGALFNLCANLLAVPLFGLYAASVITILSELLLLAIFVPLLRSQGLAPPLARLAWRPAIAAAAMAAVMLAAARIGWLAALVAGPPVYLLALLLLGAFGADERALLRRAFGR
jgi:O-antigen/teichoic acid export membrane protein